MKSHILVVDKKVNNKLVQAFPKKAKKQKLQMRVLSTLQEETGEILEKERLDTDFERDNRSPL